MRKPWIVALAIATLLALGALRVGNLLDSRQDTIDAAEARADNLALILSAYISEGFRAADASLRQLQLHAGRVGGVHAPAADWQPSLMAARTGLSDVGAITVLDRDGIIRHSTRQDILGQSRSNEFLTRVIATDRDDELFVGTPFPTVATPGVPSVLIIPIGRRITRPDGELDGLVAASFRPDAPRSLLREVNIGARGVITVFHPEGAVLFREPAEAPLEADGRERLNVVRRTATPPLVISVSIDREELLASWRGQAMASAFVFIVTSAVLAGVLVVLFRQMDAKTAAQQALARAQAEEKEHLRDANDRLAQALAREQQARQQAESASALKDDFLMTVSHELRTPLTAIHGWARMLNQGAVNEAQQRRAIDIIARNAEAQTRLIEDLLDVSGVIAGKLRVESRAVNLADVVRHAVETAAPAAAAKTIRIETRLDETAGMVMGDSARLQQIVWNLLANAVKFTPSGGTVTVAVAREGGEAVLQVRDSGIGISSEFLPHVFDRFRQEESGSHRRFGGLGLGLSIVRSLVELHGGTVTAQSDGTGTGSTFIVRLPLAAAQAGDVSRAAQTA